VVLERDQNSQKRCPGATGASVREIGEGFSRGQRSVCLLVLHWDSGFLFVRLVVLD
jgi:hypothetical protein